jgi:type IV pilus assembly protein PilN
MIKINLAPTAKKAGKAAKPKAAKAAGAGIKLPPIQSTVIYIIGIVVVVLIIAFFLIAHSMKIGNINRNINSLQSKLSELRVYVQTVDSLEKREKQLGDIITPIRDLNRNRFFVAHVMDEVSSRIPEFTWLTSLDINGGGASMGIKGTTASNLLVADFMNRLEDSPYISNVDLTVLEKKTVEKQEMMEFTLTASIGFVDTLAGRTK